MKMNLYGVIKIMARLFIGIYILEKIKWIQLNLKTKKYLTPSNWVDENECYFDDFGILLDSSEIFQIINITPGE